MCFIFLSLAPPIKIPHSSSCTTIQKRGIINRVYIFFHLTATLLLLYYRISHLFKYGKNFTVLAWALMTVSELIFTFIWGLSLAASLWKRFPTVVDMNLPELDVFICTADPQKEPTMEVMNTVLSALALDYPPEKLAVYLSDDGGSYITLYALKEAFKFARHWLPFCNKYGIKTGCPEAYFSSFGKYQELPITTAEFSTKNEELHVSDILMG